ncbi:hypothetical protein ACLUWZ_05650 [Limosilactobacillus mucosae]|uniref:hypothetical protein n=1 Tax=Limosilactobacillus mucosae TaxID=97478 RepID=UPI0039911FC4
MPANQLITKPREETDMRILIADADTMPQTYYLRDVFSEVVGRIDKCKKDGTMFRFRAVYDPIGRTPKTGMVAVDPKLIISVREEPKVAD